MSRIQIYDTTLRDGMQGEGMSLSARRRSASRTCSTTSASSFIEAGFPASNPKEAELFERLAGERFSADVCAFGMTRRRDVAPGGPACGCSPRASRPSARWSARPGSLHLEKVVRVDPEENLRMIADSVAFLAGEGVIYDAEHFFDAWRTTATTRCACAPPTRRAPRT